MSLPKKPRIQWEHLVSGTSAGVISTLVLHPLDLIKIRFQVNEGTGVVLRPAYYGIIDALKNIKKHKGYRGLYQGVAPNILGSGLSWGFYFVIYNTLKEHRQGGDFKQELPKLEYMGLAALSGAITLCMTNPIWVTKTRLCLQYDNELRLAKVPESVRYNGIYDCLQRIARTEGIRGLYKGFLPGLVGTSHGAVQFVTYESVKNIYNKWSDRDINSKMSTWMYLCLGSFSKMVAASSTYPYQVVRSRLQDQHRSYQGVGHIIKELWRFEGVRGFYKGLVPSLLRVTPASGIIFMVYEVMSSQLLPRRHL